MLRFEKHLTLKYFILLLFIRYFNFDNLPWNSFDDTELNFSFFFLLSADDL